MTEAGGPNIARVAALEVARAPEDDETLAVEIVHARSAAAQHVAQRIYGREVDSVIELCCSTKSGEWMKEACARVRGLEKRTGISHGR